MNKVKKMFYEKMFEIHTYLKKLDKMDILKLKEEANKTTNENTKEILNEYIKFRRENNIIKEQ